jgi:GT2 family glycosyltransferase
MKPTFSFLVPTHREDRPLERCLESIAWQLGSGDEVIVIGDTFNGSLPKVEHLIYRNFDERFRYMEYDAGHSCWGHCQLNAGLAVAMGDWLHVNDDDDVWAPGAVAMMRQAALDSGGRPMLFRFQSYVGGMHVWLERGRVERNWIGGHCLVTPNIPGKVGRFDCVYSGDFDYIDTTLKLHGGYESALWKDGVVAIARPQAAVGAV